MKTTIMRRASVGAALVGVVAATVSGLGAGAAAAGPLPSHSLTQTLADGTKVRVGLFGESFRIARSITAIGTTRQIWASGKIVVDAPGATGGTIDAGYIVGCQVNFLGAGVTPNTGIGGAVTNGQATLGAPSATSGSSVSLGPGQAVALHLINTTNGDLSPQAGNYLTTTNAFTNGKAGVAYSDEEFHVDSCAGYAQAKAFVTVQVDTASVTGYVTVYGTPFNIG
ncbi:MAG: MspA family porin [Corynebacteriales bacterium]|uniref:MspA family porin n=1 Tax=Williamsia herbipolensis TaxID=1603258 RepID=A0AAU4K1J0_9NOCA|nr:MspA family porin [Williamsia herbipolensis]MCX6469169.1 MspA family porin [Mycobacteriales bacterium]